MAMCLVNWLMAQYFGAFCKIMESETGVFSFLMGSDHYDGLKRSHAIAAKIA